jgi:hypothetical protein
MRAGKVRIAPPALVSMRKLFTGRMISIAAGGGGSVQPTSVTLVRINPVREDSGLYMVIYTPGISVRLVVFI